MSKADDMRRLIDLANNNKIVLETYQENESNPFKAFSSWGKVSEAGMPASVIKSKEEIRHATDEKNKQRFAGKTLEELRSMAWRHGYGKDSKEYDKFHDGVTGVPVTEVSAWKLSEYEELDEDVGGDYLYHATSAYGLKKILQSGYVNAANGPQSATKAQTRLPSVSMTRNLGYASGSNASGQLGGVFRDAILVFNRQKIENNFKTLSTSQSKDVRGAAYNPFRKESQVGKPSQSSSQNTNVSAREHIKRQGQMHTSSDKKDDNPDWNQPKYGGEFEEAIVVPKGVLPIKGTLVGFWINPRSELMRDSEIVNHPLRLDMPRPNTFVKHKEEDGVNEEGYDQLDEDLHKWFKEKWVRFGPDGKIRGDCARDDDSEGKPKCLPQSKAHSVGKKARASAAARKRRKDPNAERSGKAINVNTKKKKSNESVEQCPHCNGPMYHESMMNEKQDACYRKVKSRYKVWPSAYASGALVQCRKKGAKNWGNKSESVEEAMKPEHVTGKEKSGAVEMLEKRLLSAKQRGAKLDYDSIDEMMQEVCDEYNLTGDKLHNDFVKKHHLVPDKWIVKQVDEAVNLAQQAAIAIKTKND